MGARASERIIARFFLAVFLASLVVLWLCRLSSTAGAVGLGPSLFVFLVAPGFIPSLKIRQKLGLSFLETIPFAISLSLGQATVFLLGFDWLGLSVSNAGWALIVCTFAWYAWSELGRSWSAASEFGLDASTREGSLKGRARVILWLTLCVFLVAVAFLLFKAGAPLQWTTDAPAHLAAIQGVVEEDRIFPVAQPYGPNGVARPDPRFGIFHALCALLLIVSGAEIQTLWRVLPAFFSPFLVLGLFSAARSITGSMRVAFAAAFLFPLCYGGIGGETLRITGYPTRVSMLVYFVALSVFFRYLWGQRRWLLFLLAALVATAAAIHVYYFIEFIFVITCFFLVRLLVAWCDRSEIIKLWTKVIGVSVGISLPFLLYKFFISYSTANQYSVENQGLLYLDGRFYILNPLGAYGWFGFAGVVSLVLLAYFISRAKRSESHAFVVAATAGPLLVIFNPLVMPLASKILSYLAWRLMWAVPYVLSLAVFVTEFPVNIRSKTAKRKFLHCAGFVLVAAAVLGTLDYRIDFYRSAIETKHESFSEDFAASAGALERMDREFSGRRIFLSDPVTAYAIPAFTRHFVTAIPVAHSAPTDSFPVSRVRDALDVLNPSVDVERAVEVLRKYRVEFVVVNTGFLQRLRAFEYEIDPDIQRRALTKMAAFPELFVKVFSEGNMHVFRVSDLALAKMVESHASIATAIPTQSGSIFLEKPAYDFSDLFLLEKAEIIPAAAEPGDTIKVDLLWKCVSPLPREDVYTLFVRMDTDFPKGRLYTPSLEKPYRKFVEHRLGLKFRYRVDVDPETWVPPLHLWRRGELVRESVFFEVPEGLFPGRYAIKLNLKRISASINFHLSDFLRDQDYYSGVEIGNVVVGARAAKTAFRSVEGARQNP